jgi:hypothetical protein
MIRMQLMCHTDLSLHGTKDLVGFDLPPQNYQCRDLGAIQNWVEAHGWPEFRNYMADVLKFDAVAMEKKVVAEEREFERKTGTKLRWDGANRDLA